MIHKTLTVIRITAATIALLLLTGCAVRVASSRSGHEHIWGLGNLRLQTNGCGHGLLSVTSGSAVPGVCLNAGSESFGLAVGYSAYERIAVVPQAAAGSLMFPVLRGIGIRNGRGSVWGWGVMSLRRPSTAGHRALITGQALCGISAHAARGGAVAVGLDQRRGVWLDDDAALDLTSPKAGFWNSLFDFQVTAPTDLTHSIDPP